MTHSAKPVGLPDLPPPVSPTAMRTEGIRDGCGSETVAGDREQGLEHSLCWKMRRAYQLAGNLCFVWDERGYVGQVRDTQALFGDEASETLWAWSEGLMHKYYEDRSAGRCSLQATIDFDIGKFEDGVDRVIELCNRLHERIGLAIPEDL